MAGIFPNTGVTAPNTSNAELNPEMKAGCEDLYFPQNCNPRFNPLVMNAVISELVNAINTGQDYDCSKLNNLATVLNGIKNLCGLPTVAEPDANDSLAGCFDGESGRVSITALADLIQTLIGPCALPIASTPDLNDTLTMCVDGVPSQVSVTDFQELFPDAETNICTLPTVTAIGMDDFVGVCVDGDSAKITVEDLGAALVPPLTFFRNTQTINHAGAGGGTVPLQDFVYPRVLGVSCSEPHGDGAWSGSITFSVPQDSSGSPNVATDAVTNSIANYNQFYTYVPSLGAIYRMVGTHLVRAVSTAKNIEQTLNIYPTPSEDDDPIANILSINSYKLTVITSMT